MPHTNLRRTKTEVPRIAVSPSQAMPSKTKKTESIKPFLRWAGGKKWLVKYTDQIIDADQISGYHEPFVGGGAVFFSLPRIKRTHLSDINPRLINAYIQVRDDVETVITHLRSFQNSRAFYNEIRAKDFNDSTLSAAQFIYLNQTSFNGIYRENLNGVYNVPYGNRTKDFIQEDLLREAAKWLKYADIRCHEFDKKNFIRKGDLVFLDPPYTITHNNNGFIKYNKKLFSLDDQHRLSNFIQDIVDLGAYYILTNAAHAEIKKIFRANKPVELSRASLVSGNNAARGKYTEYLFTNLKTCRSLKITR